MDKALPVPLYHQLRAILEDRLRRSCWKPGERLPTEDELSARFGVSKATVRQALRDLVQAGLVRREQGRGTFVMDSKIGFGARHLRSFTEEMHDSNLEPASRVLEKKHIPAPEEIARRLGIRQGSEVFVLRRLRLAGGEPMGVETAYIPGDLVPGIAGTDFEITSLYEALDNRYGLVPDHASQRHFAVAVNPEEALLLEVEAGAAALGGERLTFLRAGRPMELTYSVMRGDRYQIAVKLVRTPERE